MLVQVRLLKGFSKLLFYEIPDSWIDGIEGKIINVPIKNKISPALVVKAHKVAPKNLGFKVRQAHSQEPFPKDRHYSKLISKASCLYFTEELYFYQRIRQFLNVKTTKSIQRSHETDVTPNITLTSEQEKVVAFLRPHISRPVFVPTLLHGVTGSGKTEVYVKLMAQALREGKSIIMLLPEVSLAMQFESILKHKLASDSVLGFHSATKISEKKLLWQKLLNNTPVVIIGVHLPILLPISNLGLIVVDEEHDINFQEKKHPKLNSKELALIRASICEIPILLGSATPSINSLYNVKKRGWNFLQLKRRFSGNFPTVQTVPFGKSRRPSFWITKELQSAITETLNKKEQILIFLNRRGFSFFVMCKECSFVFECPNCSVSLTLHQGEILKCHYCSHEKPLINCPKCHTAKDKLIKKGIGTQQVVKILKNLFPSARIERADLDSTTKKREWQNTVKLCENGEIDILVGTQTITKGYHFPKVTLVGVLWADMSLHFPIFNAGEITLQQLLQVAGRAGRATSHSKVILQIMNDHKIFDFLNETDYLKFYTHEMEFRRLANYPPSCRLMHVELKNTDPNILDKDALELLKLLQKQNSDNVIILGPVKPAVYKIQKTETRQIFLKSDSFKDLFKLLQKINLSQLKSSVSIVPSP